LSVQRIPSFPLRSLVLAACLTGAGIAPARSAAGEIPSWQPPATGIGYEVDLDLPPEVRPGPIRSREVESRGLQPLYVRIAFGWSRVEPEPGVVRLEELEAAVAAYRDTGFEVILCPRGGNPAYGAASLPAPDAAGPLEAWRRFLRTLGERFRGRIRFYQVGDRADTDGMLPAGGGGREFAFLVKTASVEIRSADPDALIVLGSIGPTRLDLLESTLSQDLAAYVDAVTLRANPGADPAPALDAAQEILLRHDPSAWLWLVEAPVPAPPPAPAPAIPEAAPEPPGGESESSAGETPVGESDGIPAPPPPPVGTAPTAGAIAPIASPDDDLRNRQGGAVIRTYASALAAGARLVLFDLPRGERGAPRSSSILILLRRLFPPALGPTPEGASRIRFLDPGSGEALPAAAWKFFDGSTFQAVVVYAAPDPESPTRPAVLVLDTADVSGAVVDDLLANTEVPAGGIAPDPARGTTRLEAAFGGVPLLLRYQRFATPGFLKKPEAVEVGGRKEITAEEILAKHQEFQAEQDSRLQSLIARGKISYHYRVANADLSVDVTTINAFYWDRALGAEWEQKELFFNGVKWKGRKPPELPLIQPEKVVILPLDIHLNKDYTYRYVGDEKIEGRECHVLEFTPVDPTRNLYRGRVWIDTRTFARVRIASVQTGLSPPVTSNDERDTYGPAPGSGVDPIWVLQRIDGQQIFATAGVNLVVLREVEFSDFELNPPDFADRRRAAHASEHTILRDTEHGFRYLDRTETGERVVRDGTTRSTTLGLAGVFHTKDLDFPIPLAGINRFDFDFRGTGAQTNLFFAGALVLATIQDPEFLGTRLDAGASLFGIAFSGTDHSYRGSDREDSLDVRNRTQSLSVNIGYPIGNFFKVKATGSADYVQYGGGKDSSPTLVIPRDTAEFHTGVEGEFNRRGFSVTSGATWSRRDRWDPWGETDPLSPDVGSRLADFDPEETDYLRARFGVSKQFILPLFQKVTLRGSYLTGRDLDRFSKYRFSFYGTRVRGFSGSGVRFDRGTLVSGTYSFNVSDVLRFDATLDAARVRDTQFLRIDPGSRFGGYQDFAGLGLSGNFLGPWNTVVQFDVGVALRSDIPGLRGDREFQLLLLKFF
jgi:hypothetical protein